MVTDLSYFHALNKLIKYNGSKKFYKNEYGLWKRTGVFKMIQREHEWINVNFSINACYVVGISSKWKLKAALDGFKELISIGKFYKPKI